MEKVTVEMLDLRRYVTQILGDIDNENRVQPEIINANASLLMKRIQDDMLAQKIQIKVDLLNILKEHNFNAFKLTKAIDYLEHI